MKEPTRDSVGAGECLVEEDDPPLSGDEVSARRGANRLRLIAVALAVKQAADDEQRREIDLERRIAEVRRWFGESVQDGREIERTFRRVCRTMSAEEQEQFLDDFVRTWGSIMTTANHRLREAFVGAVRHGSSTTRRRTRCS